MGEKEQKIVPLYCLRQLRIMLYVFWLMYMQLFVEGYKKRKE